MIDAETQTEFEPEVQIVYLEKEETKPITRNKSKTRKKYFESDDEDEILNPAKKPKQRSAVSVNKIPGLMEKLVKDIQIELYDSYAIETLFLNCSLDPVFQTEDQIFDFVKKTVLERFMRFPLTIQVTDKNWKDPIPKPSEHPDRDAIVIEKYSELMESKEMQEASKWRRDSPLKKEWDEVDWELFKALYKEYPDAPNSNKMIAQKMGNGVHPNHVAHYKAIYKKKLNKK